MSMSMDVSNITIPAILEKGTPMTKVSRKRTKQTVLKIDSDEGCIVWESRKHGKVPIECIKELRFGDQASFDRTELGVSDDTKDIDSRWISIIYVFTTRTPKYLSLNLIAPSHDVFRMWQETLHKLLEVRRGLMDGLGNEHMRERLWERMYWRGADEDNDEKITWKDVRNLCTRLGIDTREAGADRIFKEVDTNKTGFLDFSQFSQLVKLLKRRTDVEALYKNVCQGKPLLDSDHFKAFMRSSQGSTLNEEGLYDVFLKHTANRPAPTTITSSPTVTEPQPISYTNTAATEHGPMTPVSTIPVAASTSISTISTTAGPLVATPLPAPAATADSASSPVATPSGTIPAPALSLTPAPSQPAPAPAITMSLSQFTYFLFSHDNAAFSSKDSEVHQDMTKPLSEYYISTSHNTYLVGHQLVGVSTIEGYARALLHGCRSVELDIYDGDYEPVVYHGKTLTSKVTVRDICNAIAKYAFVASPYPIIISAEIHCGVKQQEKLVEIMQEVFGDMLVQAPVDGNLNLTELPSPEELKGKILVKAKNLLLVADAEKRDSKREAIKQKLMAIRADSDTSSTDSSYSSKSATGHVMDEIKSKLHKMKLNVKKATSKPLSGELTKLESKPKMSFALASLLVYTVGVKCRGFHDAKDATKPYPYKPEHIFSLSESKVNVMLREREMMNALIEHTRKHLVRIYPKGLRVSSTNYEPSRYWAAGAQLVAINWQTFDLGNMINMAMFYRNGKCGYVLKPNALRDPEQELLKQSSKHFFDVTIISAQQLPCPRDKNGAEIVESRIVDPVVEVTLHIPDWTALPFLPENQRSSSTTVSNRTEYNPAHLGGSFSTLPTSARTITFRTGSVHNNGFNPMWGEELCLPFDCVGGREMMELIFVRFVVWQDANMKGHEENDEGRAPLATFCTSLASLQKGFRHLPLHDQQMSQFLFSSLFVKVGIRDVD